jgi:hypothetical protein
MLALGPAQIRAQVEEIVLDTGQGIADRRVLNMKHGDAYALAWGLRAPPCCTTEPDRLKCL